MESNDKLREIANKNRVCHYFDDVIKIKNFDFDIFCWMKNYT